jgi:hypothetical protein
MFEISASCFFRDLTSCYNSSADIAAIAKVQRLLGFGALNELANSSIRGFLKILFPLLLGIWVQSIRLAHLDRTGYGEWSTI